MGIETLNAMNEGMYLSVLLMIEVIMLVTVFFAIAGFAIYLAGAAWFCFESGGTRAHRADCLFSVKRALRA